MRIDDDTQHWWLEEVYASSSRAWVASGHSCSNSGEDTKWIQYGADQATPSIRRETNYIEEDESEEIENQNIGLQGLADEGERIHSIVDEMEAEDQAAMEMEEYEGSSDDEQYSLQKEWKEHV